LDAFEEFKKQEMDFMEFVYAKAGEFSMKHEDYLDSVSFVNKNIALNSLANYRRLWNYRSCIRTY